MAKIFCILLLAFGPMVYVESLKEIHKTKGVIAVTTVVEEYEHICTLDELAWRLGLRKPFSLKLTQSRSIANGLTKHRIRIIYNGLPVRVFTLQASTNENGYIVGYVTGYIPTIEDLDTSVKRKKGTLKKAVVHFVNCDNQETNVSITVTKKDLEDFSLEKQIHVDLNTGEPSVAYYVESVIDKDTYARNPKILFDAYTLDVIDSSLNVRNSVAPPPPERKECPVAKGGNEKIPGLHYGPNTDGMEVCLNAKVVGSKCIFKNDKIIVRTANNEFNRKNAEVVNFPCEEGINDFANGAFSPAADAFHYGQVFYDMLWDWAHLSQTGKEPIELFTHFGTHFDNSFWDGRSVTFGDGSNIVFPWATREIIAHEMCHALTDFLDNVNFDNESIAVDEAFSDICGLALGVYTSGTNDWTFAPEVIKDEGLSLRYFDDPTRDGFTIANLHDWNGSLNPYQGLGIFTKFFYNIVEIEGIEFQKAFQTFVHANIIYWNEETSFYDGACGVTRAARDLGLDTGVFIRAFLDVGVDLDFCNLGCSSGITY